MHAFPLPKPVSFLPESMALSLGILRAGVHKICVFCKSRERRRALATHGFGGPFSATTYLVRPWLNGAAPGEIYRLGRPALCVRNNR